MPPPACPHSINKRKKNLVPEAFEKLSASRCWHQAQRVASLARGGADWPGRCARPRKGSAERPTRRLSWRRLSPTAPSPPILYLSRQESGPPSTTSACGCGEGAGDCSPYILESGKVFWLCMAKSDPLRNANISVFPTRKKKSLRGILLTTSSPSPQSQPLTKGHCRALTVKGEMSSLPRVTFLVAKCC